MSNERNDITRAMTELAQALQRAQLLSTPAWKMYTKLAAYLHRRHGC